MTGFYGATLYYLRRSARNRLVGLGRKMRSPRYLVAMIVTLLWFGMMFAPTFLGADRGEPFSNDTKTWFIVVFFTVQILLTWVFGAFGRGLIFKESEVQTLFAAPISRRQILVFKFLQVQGPLLVSAVIIGVLASMRSSMRFPMTCLGMWIASNFLFMHGAFMTHALRLLRKRGGVTTVTAFVPGALLLAGLVYFIGNAWPQPQVAVPELNFADSMLRVGQDAEVRAFFQPLHLLAAPIVTATWAGFFKAALYPVMMCLAQALFFGLIDFRFEDHGVAIAQKVSQIKTEGLSALKPAASFVVSGEKRPLFRLSPHGPVWRAFVWKNLVSIGRAQKRQWIGAGIGAGIMVIVLGRIATRDLDADTRTQLGFVLMVLALYLPLLATSFVRVDLRLDIPHFDVIKALPIRGRELMLGEIAATTIVLFAVQCVLVMAAAFLMVNLRDYHLDWRTKAIWISVCLPVMFCFVLTLVTGENMLALYLPSMVKLGRGMKAGFDQIGQNLLGALFRMFGMLVICILPIVLGTVMFVTGREVLHLKIESCAAMASWPASALLVFECYLLIRFSERRYNRFDLSSENLSIE